MVRFIREATFGENGNHQYTYDHCYPTRSLMSIPGWNHRDELVEQAIFAILHNVDEDREENAAICIVEQPCPDDREQDYAKGVEGKVKQIKWRKAEEGDDEDWQVPDAVQRTEDEAPRQWTILLLQAGQGETAPARLFSYSNDGSKAQQGRQVRSEDQRPVLKQAGKRCRTEPEAHIQQEQKGIAEDQSRYH